MPGPLNGLSGRIEGTVGVSRGLKVVVDRGCDRGKEILHFEATAEGVAFNEDQEDESPRLENQKTPGSRQRGILEAEANKSEEAPNH